MLQIVLSTCGPHGSCEQIECDIGLWIHTSIIGFALMARAGVEDMLQEACWFWLTPEEAILNIFTGPALALAV